MEKITIDMPLVAECIVAECAYNVADVCRARAITIGDSVFARCDTFLSSSSHTRNKQRVAGVGACKVSGCTHNEDYECMANSINVGYVKEQINCLDFMPR